MRRAAATALGGAGLTLVALTFGSAILFVPGIALMLLSLAASAWVLAAAAGARVRRRLDVERVLEGEPLEATLELDHGPLGLPGCQIEEPLSGRLLALALPTPPLRGGRTEVRLVVRFERRGVRRLPAPRLSLRDPFGLVAVARRGGGAGQEVLVLPRLAPPRPLPGARADRRAGSSAAASPEPLAAAEVDGLRAYQPGTPASRIHWPALARGAGLLERHLRADAAVGPLVVLDARSSGNGERLDRAVRAAASLTYELARRGGCELLLPGERRPRQIRPDLGGWPGVHARLALVEGGPGASPPAPPARAARAGAVFYVAAEPPPGGALRWLDRVGAAALVLPSELAAEMSRPAAFEVAGCLGWPLGVGWLLGAAERRRASAGAGRGA
jgi:uncharacterized protein (DUF58 family)